MRPASLAVLLAGVVLPPGGLLVTAESMAQEAQEKKTLQRDATQVSEAFTSYFERVRSPDLLLAQNPALRPADGSPAAKEDVEQALRYLGELYPGAIGEACVINDTGTELGRVTEGVAAPAADLSTEEESAAFFGATMALDEGEVHQALPYVSPDTHRCAISNSTWVPEANGKQLIVHFEVALHTFQKYLTTSSASQRVAVVDRETGLIALQSDTELPTSPPRASSPPSPA